MRKLKRATFAAKSVLSEGGDNMLAMLWAQNVIYDRFDCTYDNAPDLIKRDVGQILIDGGYDNLVSDAHTYKKQ